MMWWVWARIWVGDASGRVDWSKSILERILDFYVTAYIHYCSYYISVACETWHNSSLDS